MVDITLRSERGAACRYPAGLLPLMGGRSWLIARAQSKSFSLAAVDAPVREQRELW